MLTQSELEAALNQQSLQSKQLGELLLELGFVDEETLLIYLGQQFRLPAVKLRSGLVDPLAVQQIPRAKAEALCALAMFKVRDELTVALAERRDLRILDELERITGLKINPVLALRGSILKMLPRCYEENFAVDAVIADLAQDAIELQSDAIDITLGDIESLADGSPIINLVNYTIVNALRQKASDIHFKPG